MIYPEQTNERFPLIRARAVIGRDADCVIRLDHKSISRRHARIGCAEDGWFVEDLESTNGIAVNEVPVRRSILREPDFLKVGSVIFKFIGGADADVPPTDGSPDSSSGTPLQTAVARKPRPS